MPTAGTKNLYDILGVTDSATKDEIRKAYLKLAKLYHPDKTGGDKEAEDRLKEVNAAYDVLKNPEKRKKYDDMLRNPFAGGAPGAGGAGGGGFSGFESGGFGGFSGESGLGDLFDQLFGGGARRSARRGPRPGSDIETGISISVREMATGGKRTLRIPRNVRCGTCQGSGAAPGTQPETCSTCHGTGQVTSGGDTHFMVSHVCPQCRGTGKRVATPCPACRGNGVTHETSTVNVTIPPGAQTGTRLRLNGQGESGEPGAPNGDLYVVIEVQPDPFFRVEEGNVHCTMPVTFAEAAMGCTLRVPTLTGKVDIKVPAGTLSGRVFRLRGQGVPRLKGGSTGDLMVQVEIEAPQNLTPEQIELIKKFQATETPEQYPNRQAAERAQRA